MWIFVKNRPNVLHILGQTLGPILLQYHRKITCKMYVIKNELFQQQSTSPMFPVIFGSVVCSVATRKLKRKDSQWPQTGSHCPRFSWPLPRLRSLKPLDAIQFCFCSALFQYYTLCVLFEKKILIVHMADVEKLWLETICPSGLWYVSLRFLYMLHLQIVHRWVLRIFFACHTSQFYAIQRFEGYSNICINVFVPNTGNFSKGHNLIWNENFLNARMY